MPSSDPAKPKSSRRLLWLTVFVVILFGGYSAGWFYLAGKLETMTQTALAELNAKGVTAECANPTARGFPFRIGLFCDKVGFDDPDQGVSLSAGSFRSAGQIYDPMRLVAELDGPARIAVPGAGAIAVEWDLLHASTRLAKPLPERVSLEGRQMRARTEAGAPLVAAEAFEGHFRPNGGNIDLAASFVGLSLDASLIDGRKLPPLGGEADITLNNGVALLEQPVRSLRDRSGTIRTLMLSSGPDTGIIVSGPFSVDLDGLIDADLKVGIRDPKGLAVVLGEAIPEQRKQIAQGFAGLTLLGSAPSIPLRIVKGQANLGFIPLGKIKPLD